MRDSPHVLLAEDEDLVAMVVAEILESEGFRVTVTHNGLAAVEADAADPADLLLTDMRMPVMDGEALIRIIRQRRPDLPVVVTTGFSEYLPDEEPGRLVVLRKPYSLSVLAPVITALLSGRIAPTS
ncbi:response regulator (plasmid) [Azospirillum sp. TSA2s]|jgi:CheY-like chemotaxis protein|uniref:response regulator n=1 Tax=Azospirillum sp. TSA2s TaxID=709810 RepID=UPI0010AAE4E8|nr:response regulator [Azospirillum sp. TSA2s]QCG92956.1 response regulator [Azospirillum sp. TSA2s]